MEIEYEKWSAIQDAVRALVGTGSGVTIAGMPTLEVSRPNIHDSKKKFQAELDAIEGAIDGVHQTIRALLSQG